MIHIEGVTVTTKTPLHIFISSPYSNGDTLSDAERLANVKRSLDAAEKLVELGHVPFLPLLSHYWHEDYPHDYEFWMWYCVEWLKKCDGVLWLGSSVGVDSEVAKAQMLGKPVYRNVSDLPDVGNEQ